MNTNELSFEKLPEAVSQLMIDVSEMKELLLEAAKNYVVPKKKNPIGIFEACGIVNLAKPTVYALCQNRTIPCYRTTGGKLQFFEDELIEWVKTGKRKTNAEINEEANKYTSSKRR